MADQHNDNIPALTNSIAEDVVDIKENLEFHKDCFQALCEGWDNSSTAALKVDNLADDAVVEADILDDAVTENKIKDANVTTDKVKDANITQAKLKTSQGSVSSASVTIATLPGGEYGFYPQTKVSGDGCNFQIAYHLTNTSYATYFSIGPYNGKTGYGQQRYVTSSGEIHWIFILRDNLTKEISSVWQAPDHPCFGNGGKPQLVPHPFPEVYESAGKLLAPVKDMDGIVIDTKEVEMLVINPSKAKVLEMQKKTIVESETEPDKDLIEVILDDYELNETIQPAWPSEEVTVGLPPEWEETPIGATIEPIKKIIPKPAYIKTVGLKIKQVTPMEL